MLKRLFIILLLLSALVYAELDIQVDGQIITLKNLDSDQYNQSITIKLKSNENEIIIIRDTELSPGEEIEVDFSQEVYGGTYDLYVDENLVKPGFIVEGKKNIFYSLDYKYVFFVLGVIGLVLLYLILTRRSRYIKRMKYKRETRQLDQIYTQADPEKKYVQEFRDRMVEKSNEKHKFMPEYSVKKSTVPTRQTYYQSSSGIKGKTPTAGKLRLSSEDLEKFRNQSSFLKRSKLREQGSYKDKEE